MASSALANMATLDARWAAHWEAAGGPLRARLKSQGLEDPLTWAGLRADRVRMRRILTGLGILSPVDGDSSDELDICMGLQMAARSAGDDWVERSAAQSDFQLATDVVMAAKRRKVTEEASTLTRLQATAAATKPVEWLGRRFCRPEMEGEENARKRAEATDRLRWMRRVYAILVESDMPFGREAKLKGWAFDSPEASGCFRGLRAATLKKRVSDIGPFLRYLRAESGKTFPDEVSDVLHFFGICREEQAARSVYSTLVAVLSFFEEAGEVPKPLRLSTSSGLVGDAKEFETKRRLLAESLGETTSRKQAPPLTLAILALSINKG